ncbi:MAG: YihY/virulence factor BrkB family protein [Sphingomonadales bacterium]|nr:YihY/virulence factor BrkB family protein [Sphingomonadales bacterium]
MEEREVDAAGLPPLTVPDLSPEARRRRAKRLRDAYDEHVGPQGRFWNSRFFRVIARVWAGAYHDGFIHAGNLAYMAILALFPFFITVAAGFSLIGEQEQRAASVHAFLQALPPIVASALEPVAMDVIVARSGWLLWVGGLVGLWTVGSLIETIRDILRRAYGTHETVAYWRYRLISTGVIIVAVIAMLFALLAQVAIGAAQEVIQAWFPRAADWIGTLGTSRLVPAMVIYAAVYLLFLTLTPSAYRKRRYLKWPGALFVTVWWAAVSAALPAVLHRFFSYDLTYGSLAGVMIALFFFWLVGLGMVVGAELNAALTESPEEQDLLGRTR